MAASFRKRNVEVTLLEREDRHFQPDKSTANDEHAFRR
ncbi:MAG: hypothetical protein AAGA85_24445 [Bacteroidota bacterium]